MYKVIGLIAVFALLFGNVFSLSSRAEGLEYETASAVPDQEDNYGPDTKGETYCVINGETGEVLLAKNKDRIMYPASCTKIMTCLLTIENVPDLSATMTFTRSAVDIDPSSSTLDPKACEGETMTVLSALYGLMVKSANECGAMLGEYVAGSEAAFAEMMNERARKIGAVNTHFMNAYGIHNDQHYTTAYDLALIMQEAMKNETFRKIAGTAQYTIPATNMNGPRAMRNSHEMITGAFPEEGVLAGKTGSTPQAGRVLVTAAEREDMYAIAVVMGDDKENYYKDTHVLFAFAYDLRADRVRPVEWLPVNDNVTTTANVHIRYSPSTEGGIYTTLNAGTTVHRNGVYEGWSRVIYGGRYGYIATAYLQSDHPELVPSTEEYTGTEAPTDPPPETESEPGITEIPEESVSEDAESPEETTATVSPGKKDEDVGKSTWKIVLIILGSLIGAMLIAILILVILNNRRERMRRRRKRRRRPPERE
ncbi:MAG: serine hydrolase [Lachnospiraceae bacterium]|nr:serine hydrolase [Lachnospiraceae bacterium]